MSTSAAIRPHLDPLPEGEEIRPDAQNSKAITWRSLLIGTLATISVCALTPYNDFIFSDSSLVSGYLPVAAVVIVFLLIVAINAPLHRLAPRRALTSKELSIIVLMTLVSCSIPNWGLMRFLAPTPVAPFHLGQEDPEFWKAFSSLNLPSWLFPVENVHEGRTSDIAQWFYTRAPQGEHIPWRAWIIPAIAWGIFVAAMMATLVSLARLVFDQWAANERLPFPLVQVQAALIEPPQPGRALNELFLNRSLWIGLGAVFFIHSLNSLHGYFPHNFPTIPLSYNFKGLFPDPPLYYLPDKVKAASLSFVVIGATYFIRSKTALSLWLIFILTGLASIPAQMRQGDVPDAARRDQHLGACIAFVGGILWIGRHHWIRVLKNAFGIGEYRGYRMTFWIGVAGMVVMTLWLRAVGVHLWFAVLIVLFIVGAHIVTSRVLAETGLPFYRSVIAVSQAYTSMPFRWFTGRDIYFAGVFTSLGPTTTRDGLMGFAMHGMGVTREAGVTQPERRKLGYVIAWALLVGVLFAGVMTLYCQYSYPTPMQADTVPARNFFGAEYIPKRDINNPMLDYARGKFTPKPSSTTLNLGIGFGATILLQLGTLRWASWPLLPVGFVTSYGPFMGNAWLSIFVGWLAKVLIVRLGGAGLFQRLRPLFIGLIFGEALAAGFWLLINALVVLNGGNSQTVKFVF